MFMRGKGASWSDMLLRDELFHAGIRHSRTRLEMVGPAKRQPPATPYFQDAARHDPGQGDGPQHTLQA